MTSAVVIGAGVVGAAVAYHLAEAGAAVSVLDAGEPAGGATGHSFARLSAVDKDPYSYFRLNHAGMREHALLAERLAEQLGARSGAAPWLHRCGAFLWADPDRRDALRHRAEQLREWGYPLRWRPVEEVNRELAAPVRGAAAAGPLLHATDEGWVDAPALTRQLLAAAGRRGADVRAGAPVVELARRGGGWQVGLAGGGSLPADVVVNVAGAAAPEVAALAGAEVALTPSRGLLLDLAAPGDPVRHIVHGTQVSIRPDGPGRAVVRSEQVDQQLAAEPDPTPGATLAELGADLLRRAAAVIPALARATVCGRRIGWRVLPAGGYPSVGGCPDLPGYYQAVSHSGVILAPLIGRLLAREITSGQVDALLSPYHPAGPAAAGADPAAAGPEPAGLGRGR